MNWHEWSIDYGTDGAASLWHDDCAELDFDPVGMSLADIMAAAKDHECRGSDE